jgi:maleate cis-trans isomerase
MNARTWPSRGRARIGVVVPVSNTNLEPDLAMLAPPGVSLHFARAGGYDVDRIPDENQMRQYSDTPADEIFDGLRLCRSDFVIYGCTSATLAQGPDYDASFRQHIEALCGVPAITAAAALIEVLRDIGVERFAFTSPYVSTLSDLAIGFIEAFDMHCVARIDAPQPMSNDAVAAATPDEIVSTALKLDCSQADALVVSCTDYRATEAIPLLEQRLGIPVVTSNQASLLVALGRLGIELYNTPLGEQLAAQRKNP